MTRKFVLIGFLAVLAFGGASALVGVPTVAGGAEDPAAGDDLADEIREQSNATADAMALTNDPWVPRTAGLGIGLAVGLLGGGLLAYATRGDGG